MNQVYRLYWAAFHVHLKQNEVSHQSLTNNTPMYLSQIPIRQQLQIWQQTRILYHAPIPILVKWLSKQHVIALHCMQRIGAYREDRSRRVLTKVAF